MNSYAKIDKTTKVILLVSLILFTGQFLFPAISYSYYCYCGDRAYELKQAEGLTLDAMGFCQAKMNDWDDCKMNPEPCANEREDLYNSFNTAGLLGLAAVACPLTSPVAVALAGVAFGVGVVNYLRELDDFQECLESDNCSDEADDARSAEIALRAAHGAQNMAQTNLQIQLDACQYH